MALSCIRFKKTLEVEYEATALSNDEKRGICNKVLVQCQLLLRSVKPIRCHHNFQSSSENKAPIDKYKKKENDFLVFTAKTRDNRHAKGNSESDNIYSNLNFSRKGTNSKQEARDNWSDGIYDQPYWDRKHLKNQVYVNLRDCSGQSKHRRTAL